MPRPWRRCWLPALPARRLRPAAYSVPAGPRRRARPPLACAVPPTLHRAHTIPPCALAPPRCLLPLCRQPPWGGKTRRAPGPACAHHRTTRTPTTRYTRPRFFDHDALHVPGLDDDVRGLCGTAITSDHQHSYDGKAENTGVDHYAWIWDIMSIGRDFRANSQIQKIFKKRHMLITYIRAKKDATTTKKFDESAPRGDAGVAGGTAARAMTLAVSRQVLDRDGTIFSDIFF